VLRRSPGASGFWRLSCLQISGIKHVWKEEKTEGDVGMLQRHDLDFCATLSTGIVEFALSLRPVVKCVLPFHLDSAIQAIHWQAAAYRSLS